MDYRTARLSLHAIDELEAQRIRERAPQPGEAWAADYPFEADLAAIGGFLRDTEQNGEQRPFGYYQIRCLSEGLVVGGVCFKGPPDGEVIESVMDWRPPREDAATRRRHWQATCRLPPISA